MKSKILAGLCTLGLSLSAMATGCGDSDADAPGGGGGGDTTTTGGPQTGSTIQSGTVTATNSSTGTGNPGDGNDSFADADPLEENNGIPGISDSDAELNPPDSDVDYYTFQGLAGLASIQATSKPDGDPFASTDPDIVLSLYDDQQALLAVNDDPYPRTSQDSTILTILPADGLYYLKVEEFCNTPNSGCDAAYYMGLRDYSYAIDIFMEAADVLANPKAEAEPNDGNGMASNGDPLMAMAGQYYLTLGYGEFGSMTDVDFFSFTMPTDIEVDTNTELEAFFTFQPPGAEAAEGRGSGSSRFSGSIQVIDSTNAIIGVQDYSNETSAVDFPDLSLPLTPGSTYFVRITGGAADASGPLAPFYIYANGFSQSNPLETAEATNNLLVSPEVLQHPDGNTTGYFVSGHIPAGDLADHYSIASDGNTGLTVVCAGGRIGSGVEDLQADILAGSDGAVLGSVTETGDAEILIGGDGMPIDVTGETTLIIKITGAANPLVTSNHYRCGFGFSML